MDGSDDKLPGRVLAMLCAGRGWSRKQLARMAKLRPAYLSELVNGHAPLPSELLLRLAGLMGYRPAFVATLLAELGQAQGVEPEAPVGPEEKIDALAEGAAKAFETGIREATLAAHRDALSLVARSIGDDVWRYYRELPQAERGARALKAPLFWRWGFVERLCRESEAAAADDLARAKELAELAVAVAERIRAKEGWRSRLTGYAWAFVANALRVAGNLHGAEQAFARAKQLWAKGVGFDTGLLSEARFLDLEASLRRDQRRFPEALSCSRAALTLAEPGARPELLISLAKLLIEMNRHEEAIPTLEEALALLNSKVEVRLSWAARFNHLVCLSAIGRAAEGDSWLPILRRLALKMGNALDRLRFRWLEGQVHAAQGRRPEAIAALEEAREGFVARAMRYDVALTGLEICALLLEEGRATEVKAEAPLLVQAFSQLKIEREFHVALSLFCSAAEAQRATPEQARAVLALLQKAIRAGQPEDHPESQQPRLPT